MNDRNPVAYSFVYGIVAVEHTSSLLYHLCDLGYYRWV